MRDRLLIVDDDIGVRKQIYWGLRDSFDVREAEDPESALARFNEFKPAVVTLDIRLSGPNSTDGMTLLRNMLVEDPSVCIIMVTADADESNATRAIELGAWDYHTKPVVTATLAETAVRAARVRRLRDLSRHRREVLVDATDFETWLGTSALARRVTGTLERLAAADTPVLIAGEPGTGRELAARALHELGPSPDTFFVQLDGVGGLPEMATLPERATLFLDDVTALDAAAVVRLGEWLAAAGSRRVIASAPFDPTADSRRDAAAYGCAGMLAVVLPPLRAHREDIPGIADRLLGIIGRHMATRAVRFAPEAQRALMAPKWPGNFRELERRILGAAVVADGDVIGESDLWPTPASGFSTDLRENVAMVEQLLVQRALETHGGNVSRAAQDLNVSRQTLHSLMRKHAIDAETYRQGTSG